MNIEIKSVSAQNCEDIINFYYKYGEQKYEWYKKKLKEDILNGRIVGKICQIKGENEVLGSYLGRIQPLLSNPSIKAIQSIDTLIAPPLRGGIFLRSLANEFYKQLKEKSFVYIYGLPNKKIEKFRYRVLKWKPSHYTFSYTIFIPIFILKFIFKIFNFFSKKKITFNFSIDQVNSLKKSLYLEDTLIENYSRDVYWITSENFYFTYVGLCRTGKKNLSKYEIFYLLMIIANSAKGFFLKTYATKNSETGKIFQPFSIIKKNLPFSGLDLSHDNRQSLNNLSFELIEFDTFGLL